MNNADILCDVIHEAFDIASTGRPGPVLVDLPKDIQLTKVKYKQKINKSYKVSSNSLSVDPNVINKVANLLINSEKPIIYGGGGLINSGPEASKLMTELVDLIDAPVTLTLMGLGAVPNDHKNFLGMLGMH